MFIPSLPQRGFVFGNAPKPNTRLWLTVRCQGHFDYVYLSVSYTCGNLGMGSSSFRRGLFVTFKYTTLCVCVHANFFWFTQVFCFCTPQAPKKKFVRTFVIRTIILSNFESTILFESPYNFIQICYQNGIPNVSNRFHYKICMIFPKQILHPQIPSSSLEFSNFQGCKQLLL